MFDIEEQLNYVARVSYYGGQILDAKVVQRKSRRRQENALTTLIVSPLNCKAQISGQVIGERILVILP